MINFQRRYSLLALLFSASCASGPRSAGKSFADYSVLTGEQLEQQHYQSVYEAVLALRSNWLSTRGTDSFRAPSQVWVYLDNSRLGGVQSLTTVSTHGVVSVTHLSGLEATARWGIGHSAGAISIITWPGGERGTTDDDSDAPTTSARFEWFDYQGNDSVYRANAAGADSFHNPVLAGFYPDPSITRAGDDYYLVTSSFAYFPGVPIFHSRDLVNWKQLGSVLTRRSQLALDSAGISRGIFAPVIRYHAGTYYMITTLVDRGGTFFVTASEAAGPWSDPVWLPSVDGIDPSFFFDDDGKAYVINNGPPIGAPLYEGHRAIWMQEFDVATHRMVGPRSMIVNGGVDLAKQPIWIEAPHIFKRGGKYYLICAEGGTAEQHSEVVFRADDVGGPYRPGPTNPILTQRQLDRTRPAPITSTGHADFVETQAGEWWAVFLGTRPYADDSYNIGRETFLLPVRWVNDWPAILDGRESVPYVARRPRLPIESAASAPMHGNFEIRDEFDGTELGSSWQLIRTPHERWYDLTSSPGKLTILPRHAGFGPEAQPSFIGRRQQHLDASASTAMRYVPTVDGDKAGLVAFQNDRYYYFLAVGRIDGRNVVRLEKHAGEATGAEGLVLASAPIKLSSGAPVFLKIQARGGRYDFFYATREGDWKLLHGDADGTILSTKVAGGFVGTLFGMYAYSAAP
ncbi:MAG: glycoside hydrolase family 43 [Gemmatimonadetes bacterium]|nr:glycoside hydrolase family 43 [Gemmatimonadota bacterium]